MTSPERNEDVEERDRRLIEGLCRNDRESLASIYDAYGGLAYGLAFHTMRSASEAEDVVQDSFLALWRQAARLDPQRGLRSYLLTIVHNKAIDRLRQRGRRAENTLNLEAASNVTDKADTEEALIRQAEQQSVRDAMVSLPEEQRRTLEMTYFNGLTLSDVAERMQVPLGTVKSRLRLALGHLRQRLAEP